MQQTLDYHQTEISTQKYTSYINVDSSQRTKQPNNNYYKLYNLPPYPIQFINGSSHITVNFPDHLFRTDDRIVLDNIISKNVMLNDVLTVKKNSYFVRIHHQNHGMSFYGLYDPTNSEQFVKIGYVDMLPQLFDENDIIPDVTNEYYILKNNPNINLTIQLSNINGSDATRTFIGNIPVNYLNKKHIVYLIFIKNGQTFYFDPNSYLVILEKISSINYADGKNYIKDRHGNSTTILSSNNIYVRFNNLFGVPLNYLNSGTPINEDKKYPYVTIISTTPGTFTVDINYPAVVDPNISFYNGTDIVGQDFDIVNLLNSNKGGGAQILTRKIMNMDPGYPNPNNYVYKLDHLYKNIIQARLVGSVFPNSQRIINNIPDDIVNNKLYWRNLDDGDYIYQLSITPGNYSSSQLKEAIENKFNNTIRYHYTNEYLNGILPQVIETMTPNNNLMYDERGHNKYHIVDVTISDITDEVSLSSFKEIIQSNNLNNHQILSIPDTMINFTMAEDLRINFGIDLSNSDIPILVPQIIKPFDPQNELLFIYFTPNSHMRIQKNFSHAYGNLYKYIKHYTPNIGGYNTFLAQLEKNTAILFNFHRTKKIFPQTESENELRSINTSVILTNFNYDYLTKEVQKQNHNLKVGDIMVTDQFIDPSTLSEIFVYEIDNVIDTNRFTVVKFNHGDKYKFVYDGIIINFNSPQTKDSQYWLDQITPEDEIVPLDDPSTTSVQNNRNNTLSFVEINPLPHNKNTMKIFHPNHQLSIGDKITISNSGQINQVPENMINTKHTISKILNENNYEVILPKYIPTEINMETGPNMVSIKYPNIFQLFFNFANTMGNLLNFSKVGENIAITPYKHTISNTDPYTNDYNYESLGTEYQQPLKKLEMTGYNYFYLCCPELATINNTKPVQNVFAIIRWFDNPGAVVFDSFVPTIKYFSVPVSISELHFSLYHPDGRLVEFNGLDHSFVIEIIEIYNQPTGTDINARTNSEFLARKF
jgi:hypothetical protein